MGPHVFACGNRRAFRARKDRKGQLQWGRTFLRAEMRRHPRVLERAGKASMGPHVFACGNVSYADALTEQQALQWGRTFLRAEISVDDDGYITIGGFNGAARFCVRKWSSSASTPRAHPGFNGAARFCVRKSDVEEGDGRIASGVLQWGRTFLRAEMPSASPSPRSICALQWGRTFLRAEILPCMHSFRCSRRFNGAARFCVRKSASPSHSN